MNLEGWTFILTLGHSWDIYGYGCLRVGIDRETGQKRISYVRRL